MFCKPKCSTEMTRNPKPETRNSALLLAFLLALAGCALSRAATNKPVSIMPPPVYGPFQAKSGGVTNAPRKATNLMWHCGWQTSVHPNSNDSAWAYRNVCTGHEIRVSTNMVDWKLYAVTDRDTFQWPLTNDTSRGPLFFRVGAVLGSGCCGELIPRQQENRPMDSVVSLKVK